MFSIVVTSIIYVVINHTYNLPLINYDFYLIIDRFLRKLIFYMRNKTWPKGSIAEGYLGDEIHYVSS